MKITLLVKPKKAKVTVEIMDENHLIVSVKEPPVDGRANTGVINALSHFFDISPNEINIISGHACRVKTVTAPDSVSEKLIQTRQEKLI